MTHLTYGEGRIYTNHGMMDGDRCLMLRDTKKERPVGATFDGEESPEPRENFDVILSFRNIEGARLLQDQLNDMICKWSKELSVKVTE